MKQFIVLITIGMIALSLVACDELTAKRSADAVVQAKTEQAMREANSQIGMPSIVNYQEKKLAKMIYELRDQEKLVCYAYIVNHMTGELVFIGKCIGFGLPYTVQYSNPERIVVNNMRASGSLYGTLPQPEPNGLFMPQSLSATWLMMIDPSTGDARPTYIEPEIIVSPFKLHG